VLFDLDGTLFESTHLLLTGYRHTVRTCLGLETTEADWVHLLGRPLRDQMAAFSEELADEMVRIYRAWYARNHNRLIRCYPGAAGVVERLSRSGLKLAAVTSKRGHFARRGLRFFDLEGFFEAVVGEEDVTHRKPHPEPLLKALAILKVAPLSSVMVGDSCDDIECAHAAGVTGIGALWGPYARERLKACAPDCLLEDIRELPALLGV